MRPRPAKSTGARSSSGMGVLALIALIFPIYGKPSRRIPMYFFLDDDSISYKHHPPLPAHSLAHPSPTHPPPRHTPFTTPHQPTPRLLARPTPPAIPLTTEVTRIRRCASNGGAPARARRVLEQCPAKRRFPAGHRTGCNTQQARPARSNDLPLPASNRIMFVQPDT